MDGGVDIFGWAGPSQRPIAKVGSHQLAAILGLCAPSCMHHAGREDLFL